MSKFADFSNGLTDEVRLDLIKRGDPRMSSDEAREYMMVLQERYDEKQSLLKRGMSNQMAEKFLDRKGWPRPFGWHTVFFYPDSNRLRGRYIVVIAVVIFAASWALS